MSNNLYRGTTPTFTFTLPNEVDITLADNVYVTFSNSNEEIIFTKTGNDLKINPQSVSVFLTQEETLSLPSFVKYQLNWTYDEEGVVKRACSKKKTLETDSNLLSGVVL